MTNKDIKKLVIASTAKQSHINLHRSNPKYPTPDVRLLREKLAMTKKM